MPKVNVYNHAWNKGVIDRGVLARTDLQVAQLAAEDQTNLLCLATGRGFFRPGLEYLGATASSAEGRIKEFVFSASDACLLEFTNLAMRVWANDALVTRPAVTSTITSGDFSSGVGWTDASTTDASATVSGGQLNLITASVGSLAVSRQQVATSTPDVEHALRIVVDRGPVTFRCGSTSGGDEYIAETELKTGVHSLAFVPTGSYWVQFQSDSSATQSDSRTVRLVDSISVEAAGVLSLPTPWEAADLDLLRLSQSADVVFVACRGKQQRRIERRGIRGESRSWSVVLYAPDNGPFSPGRTARVRLQADIQPTSASLLSDRAFFQPEHVGALFKLNLSGQRVVARLSSQEQYTPPIKVTGVNNSEDSDVSDRYDDRRWAWEISGTWAGTLNVFRSFDGEDVGYKVYRAADGSAAAAITANGNDANTDNDNNATTWYRIGFAPGNYTSGTAQILIDYDGGSSSGIFRVISYTSPTEVEVEVIQAARGGIYTDDWQEGQWSEVSGYPSAVALYEGRLWWAGGGDRVWGSVSDDFENFDEETEGDAGPINRVLATSGVNDTQWMAGLQRLVIGTEGTETTARSSSFDEPLTPTNTMLKDASTVGSSSVAPARIDSRIIFADRSGHSLFEIVMDPENGDYGAAELTKVCKDLFGSAVSGVAAQRRPDTRIWCWLEDGNVVCIVYEPAQQIVAFIPIVTDGNVESIAVLPSEVQDRVYFVVARTVNATTVRYVERMALDSEARPATVCKVLDSSVAFTNAPASTTVQVGTHLAGRTVRVWADGAPVTETESIEGSDYEVASEFVVSAGGEITLPTAVTTGCVGLSYTWRYKSGRLAYGAAGGTAMLQDKKVSEVGLIMTDFARAGVRYGAEFDNTYHPLRPLPIQRNRQVAPEIVIGDVHDEEPFVLDAGWTLDSRVCLEGESPFPASLLGMTLAITTHG